MIALLSLGLDYRLDQPRHALIILCNVIRYLDPLG